MQNSDANLEYARKTSASRETPYLVPDIAPIAETVSKLPATRYYGSKRRLLHWLYSKFKALEFDTVLDAFGGTASVSQLFRAMHKTVTYHDAFKFNSDVAATVLAPDIQLTEEEVSNHLALVEPMEGVIARNFGGVFFLDQENAWIDGFMEATVVEPRQEKGTSLLLYLLYQACLSKRPFNLFHRANLNLRTRTGINRTFGNFSTWERSFSYHMMRAYEQLVVSRIPHAPPATVLSAQDALTINSSFDLVYIDPPYLSTNSCHARDDYWRRYHFLEGLSTYENWEEKLDPNSDIRLMPTPPHFAVWSTRATFKDALFELVRRHRKSLVALSYVKSAYPSQEELRKFFESLFADVSVHSVDHVHALSKSRKRELLFVGIPK